MANIKQTVKLCVFTLAIMNVTAVVSPVAYTHLSLGITAQQLGIAAGTIDVIFGAKLASNTVCLVTGFTPLLAMVPAAIDVSQRQIY